MSAHSLKPYSLRLATRTNPGLVRTRNEDSVFGDDVSGFMAIADGLGGHQHGQYCSQMAIDLLSQDLTLKPIVSGADLESRLNLCNQALIKHQKHYPAFANMRSTIVCAQLTADNTLCFVWAGDSRLYHYSDQGGLLQLTKDHTLKIQKLSRGEQPKPGDDNILTKSLGGNQVFEPGQGAIRPMPSDRLLLATDGLTHVVTHDQIETHFAQYDGAPESLADALIDQALNHGGPDNVTVLVAEILAA